MTQDQEVKSEGLEQVVKMPAVSYKQMPYLS